MHGYSARTDYGGLVWLNSVSQHCIVVEIYQHTKETWGGIGGETQIWRKL